MRGQHTSPNNAPPRALVLICPAAWVQPVVVK